MARTGSGGTSTTVDDTAKGGTLYRDFLAQKDFKR